MKKLLLLLLFIPLVSFGQKQNKYVKDIKVKVDKFDNTSMAYNPMNLKGTSLPNWVNFSKHKDEKGTDIFVKLTTYGRTLTTNEKGVIILFEDGTKLEYPNMKIDVEPTSNSWKYSAFIKLDENKLQNFIDRDLDGFKLYIHTKDVFSKKDILRYKGWAQGIKEIELN